MISIENIVEICVAIDIAILGIAYPIIVDKTSNIGDKYQSEYLSVLFNYEYPQKALKFKIGEKEYNISLFKLILFATLISFLFVIFKSQPFFGWDNWFINNSANFLVFAFTILLTVLFFKWLEKVSLFNGKSSSLLSHIIRENDALSEKDEKRQYYLKAINEMTYYAIEKQDEHLQETLLEFYYKTFANIRRNNPKDALLVYPVDLYFMVNKLNEESTVVQNRKLRAIEHRAVSGIWLLGEDFEEIIISNETYHSLWRNIYTICDYPRLVKMFWAHSSQYYDYRLRLLIPNYESGGNISNEIEVERRDLERQRFLEFHYALGGLMYYRGQYDILKYFFEFTQSQPPKYVLLPKSMAEIFHWFEHFSNEYKNIGAPIDFKYYFPELDNLGNRRQVTYWICCYLTILFIRQFFQVQYYSYQNFTDLPNLPDEVGELGNWLNNISFFEKCLKDVRENTELLHTLNYEEDDTKKAELEQFVEHLKQSITDKIGNQKLNAELSERMIQNFYEGSNSILGDAFREYDSIFIPLDEQHKEGRTKVSVTGSTILMSKAAFTEGDTPHINYDTVFAAALAREGINRYIPNSFAIARTKRYLLRAEDLIPGLTRLIGEHTGIVLIGIGLHYQAKEIIDKSSFKSRVLEIPATEYGTQDLIFVVRKDDLPAIEHRALQQEEIDELRLVLINDELKIYGSVIDINKEENRETKDRWNLENDPNNQDLKVQLALAFLSVIHWKDSREVVQISVNTEYREQGIPNVLNDIMPFEKSADK
ncbi:hypothetical protein [Chryseobacterium salivictor]|uniref:Uncharacterized protein n=1 Tax=Chryseobacterium salivictor TaxID=2547600 RepID=A0A4P6ZIV6_9FLAO|nr:hypothetical protein [Chryseobacterium salivictor]QBO59552.1 hypothetical protein NBC122_02751 [Chryseobacterium salivictor]